MNDKYMFEAKRLDNGEMIQGRLTYGVNGIGKRDSIAVYDEDKGVSIEYFVDPSTIKPLFTTCKPDVWLFENVDKKPFINCTPEEREVIIQAKAFTGPSVDRYVSSMSDWENSDNGDMYINYIYRVKAPGYSFDDAMTDLRNNTEEAGVFCGGIMVVDACSVKFIINKFAKANGLGGKDE